MPTQRSTFVLDLVQRQYEIAAKSTVRRVVLELPAAQELTRLCTTLFRDVDRDDDRQRRVAKLAWTLKTTVIHTLLPFADERLHLASIILEILVAAEATPSIEPAVRRLKQLTDFLLSDGTVNPKREHVLEILRERPDVDAIGAGKLGLLAKLHSGFSPGWPADASATDFGSQSLELIGARRDLRDQTFATVVFSGSPRFAPRPLIQDLLYGGRTAEVVLLAYRSEHGSVPLPLTLPSGAFFESRHFDVPHATTAEGPELDGALDRWVDESFWSEIRSQSADAMPESDSDVAVPARFVLFGDDTGAFMRDDRTVIELADLLDSTTAVDVTEDRLPRKPVRMLEEGDVIVLRLSGGGDYVDDVADTLMGQAGLSELRGEATDWKPWLHVCMKRHGEGVVARFARGEGIKLRSPSYLWVWAGDDVIAPQDYETFKALVVALYRLDEPQAISAASAYSHDRWEKMERLKGFHHRAGVEIRKALLQRVRQLVAARQEIRTSMSIELPGLNAGQMGLFRVAAVDHESVRVPLSKLLRRQTVRQA